jgi:hypothetical protein
MDAVLGHSAKGVLQMKSKCETCGKNKSTFLNKHKFETLKQKHGEGLISNLIGRKIPVLSDIPILNMLF